MFSALVCDHEPIYNNSPQWLYYNTFAASGVSKAGPSRAGALPNIQGAHPTPLAKNVGRRGNFACFSILRPLSKENIYLDRK